MKTLDILKRASRSLSSSKTRTVLTSLAIAVGAFTLTLAIGAGAGATKYADQLVNSNLDPTEIYVARDDKVISSNFSSATKPQEYSENSTNMYGTNIYRLDEADLKKISSTSGVESIRTYYSLSPLYITRDGYKKYTGYVNAYNSDKITPVVTGNLKSLNNNEVALPSDYLKLFGFKNASSAINQTIQIAFKKTTTITNDEVQQAFLAGGMSAVKNLKPYEIKTYDLKVKAITKQSTTSISNIVPIYLSQNQAGQINDYLTKGTDDYQKYLMVYAKVKDGKVQSNLNTTADRLKKEGFKVTTAKDTEKTIMQFINVLQGIVSLFGILAIIASVFGIINTQYISVLERTREIGLMKALGAKSRDIKRLFQYEAAWIGLLGGIIGAGLAVLIGNLLNPTITSNLGLDKGTYLLVFDPTPIAILIISLVIVAMLAGYLPSRKAAKLDPIKALRTE